MYDFHLGGDKCKLFSDDIDVSTLVIQVFLSIKQLRSSKKRVFLTLIIIMGQKLKWVLTKLNHQTPTKQSTAPFGAHEKILL